MRFKPKPFEVTAQNPFEGDLLSRKQSAEVLTDFVSSLGEPFVLSINSSFGRGKTTFLRMWIQHLRNQGFRCLCFNAWETDFTDSPLVSLMGEIEEEIERLKHPGKNEKLNKLAKQATKVTTALLKTAIPVGVKLATSGLLDLSHIKEHDLAKVAEEFAKQQLEKYKHDKRTIHQFKTQLADLVKTLSETDGEDNPKPIVFAIDELDRCRPPYAVELLEKIKHLFSVEGLVFVLAMDTHQLGESIKAMYGPGMDTDGYLRRFIDLEFCLPDPDPKDFVAGQFARFGLDEAFASKIGEAQRERRFIQDCLPLLFSLFRFSFRTQEQCFTHLALVLRTTPPEFFLYGFFLSFLICLRHAKRSLYFQYCYGEIDHGPVLSWLEKLPGGPQFRETNIGMIIEADVIDGIKDFKQRQTIKENVRTSANSEPASTHSQRAKFMSQYWQQSSFSRPDDITGYLFPKIEFLSRFVKPKG